MPGSTEQSHIVRFWRGTRASYNTILTGGQIDYWTRYSVKEDSGLWNEYFGANLVTPQSGQLLPVIDIVKSVPTDLKNGDRYLLETEETGKPNSYNIIEVRVFKQSDGSYKSGSVVLPFDETYSVRVKNRGYMSYQLVDGKLITYDQVDCGTY